MAIHCRAVKNSLRGTVTVKNYLKKYNSMHMTSVVDPDPGSPGS
jgi:hypothetical protein